jgi:hypothetical protein
VLDKKAEFSDAEQSPITYPPENVDDIPALIISQQSRADLQIKLADAVHKRSMEAQDRALSRQQKNRDHFVGIIVHFVKLILAIIILAVDISIIIYVAFASGLSPESKQWLLLFLGGIFGTAMTYIFGGKEKVPKPSEES